MIFGEEKNIFLNFYFKCLAVCPWHSIRNALFILPWKLCQFFFALIVSHNTSLQKIEKKKLLRFILNYQLEKLNYSFFHTFHHVSTHEKRPQIDFSRQKVLTNQKKPLFILSQIVWLNWRSEIRWRVIREW